MTATQIESLSQQLANELIRHDQLLATAESCTGGGLAELLTRIPGSSTWFERGFVTYSNAAKASMLAVPETTLDEFGAVSEETARAMAKGAILNSHAHLAVSITGIAGPEGGTEEKPVGLVCFGWSQRDGETRTAQIIFSGDNPNKTNNTQRITIRQQACLMAMQGLLEFLPS